MSELELRPDCAKCAALCCVALAFDRSDAFGFDKRAGEPCRNLGAGGHCNIYGQRLEQGFRGCVGYDCLGAGHHVTQTLFAGRSWQDEPDLLVPMMRAFERARVLREHLLLVRQALAHELPPALSAIGQSLSDTLTSAILEHSQDDELLGDVTAFLSALRPFVARPDGRNLEERPGPRARLGSPI